MTLTKTLQFAFARACLLWRPLEHSFSPMFLARARETWNIHEVIVSANVSRERCVWIVYFVKSSLQSWRNTFWLMNKSNAHKYTYTRTYWKAGLWRALWKMKSSDKILFHGEDRRRFSIAALILITHRSSKRKRGERSTWNSHNVLWVPAPRTLYAFYVWHPLLVRSGAAPRHSKRNRYKRHRQYRDVITFMKLARHIRTASNVVNRCPGIAHWRPRKIPLLRIETWISSANAMLILCDHKTKTCGSWVSL